MFVQVGMKFLLRLVSCVLIKVFYCSENKPMLYQNTVHYKFLLHLRACAHMFILSYIILTYVVCQNMCVIF